jgi:hypothetical protein
MPLDLPDALLTGEGTLDKRKNLVRLEELVDLPYEHWAQLYF